MWKTLLASAAAAGMLWFSLGTGVAAAPVPADDKGAWMHVTADARLSGKGEEVAGAVREPSPVRYKILVVRDAGGEDMTDYLERVAAQWQQPRSDTLLLVVFTDANNDIRFFMGSDFRRYGVSVAEMLGYVRRHYQPKASRGDAAGGLSALIRQVNTRVRETETRASEQAMKTVLGHLERADAEALATLVPLDGLVAGPYKRAGTPAPNVTRAEAAALFRALLEGARPRLVGYQFSTEPRIDLILAGLNEVSLDSGEPLSMGGDELVKLALTGGARGEWRLWLVSTDEYGVLKEELAGGGYRDPFGWFSVGTDTARMGSISYDRRPGNSQSKGHYSTDAAEMRSFLGSIPLPGWLAGQEAYLYTQDYEADGARVTGLSSQGVGIRRWHQGYERVHVSVGRDIDVKTSQRIVGGRPALLVTYTAPKGKVSEEMWLVDGNTVYELRDDTARNQELLMQMARTME